MTSEPADFEALAVTFAETLATIANLARDIAQSALATSSPLAAMNLAEGASDVVAAGTELIDTERTAIIVVREETARTFAMFAAGQIPEWTVREQPRELERLRIGVKSWFFFVRALCDSVYKLLMAIETKTAAPQGGSMSTALKNGRNPVALLLNAQAPSWLDWFRNFKDMRDEIKEGVGVGISDLGADGIGLLFQIYTPQRGLVIDLSGERTVSMRAIVESGTRLVEVLTLAHAPVSG